MHKEAEEILELAGMMLAGSTLGPQAVGFLSITTDSSGATCALGAVLAARELLHTPTRESGFSPEDILVACYPVLIADGQYPLKDLDGNKSVATSLRAYIWHLNDCLEWSREDIAQRLIQLALEDK